MNYLARDWSKRNHTSHIIDIKDPRKTKDPSCALWSGGSFALFKIKITVTLSTLQKNSAHIGQCYDRKI